MKAPSEEATSKKRVAVLQKAPGDGQLGSYPIPQLPPSPPSLVLFLFSFPSPRDLQNVLRVQEC